MCIPRRLVTKYLWKICNSLWWILNIRNKNQYFFPYKILCKLMYSRDIKIRIHVHFARYPSQLIFFIGYSDYDPGFLVRAFVSCDIFLCLTITILVLIFCRGYRECPMICMAKKDNRNNYNEFNIKSRPGHILEGKCASEKLIIPNPNITYLCVHFKVKVCCRWV